MTSEVVPATGPLTALARRANDAHQAFSRGAGETLAHALEAGRALCEAKRQVTAGQWLSWLGDNVEFSERTARLYMQLAAHPAMADRQRVADLSLRAAAKIVAVPHRARPGIREPRTVEGSSVEEPETDERPDETSNQQQVDYDGLARVRQVVSALDQLLARAQSGRPGAATAKLLLEAAAAARAVSAGLEALAAGLEG